MKRIIIGLLLAISAAKAFAYYMPEQGRWLSRDPIGEDGGKNLNGFAANDPVNKWDRLGHEVGLCYYDNNGVWTCRSPLQGCCNGQIYLYATHCCRQGKVIAKAPVETGIVTHKWTGTPGAHGVPVHYWISWNDGSADANSYALIMQPGDGKVSSPAGQTPSPNKPTPLKLSPCEYDFNKLNACLSRLAAEWNGKYFGMCWDFPPFLIDACKKESKGCTLPD
jgi:hypothetical protein